MFGDPDNDPAVVANDTVVTPIGVEKAENTISLLDDLTTIL